MAAPLSQHTLPPPPPGGSAFPLDTMLWTCGLKKRYEKKKESSSRENARMCVREFPPTKATSLSLSSWLSWHIPFANRAGIALFCGGDRFGSRRFRFGSRRFRFGSRRVYPLTFGCRCLPGRFICVSPLLCGLHVCRLHLHTRVAFTSRHETALFWTAEECVKTDYKGKKRKKIQKQTRFANALPSLSQWSCALRKGTRSTWPFACSIFLESSSLQIATGFPQTDVFLMTFN